MGTTRVAKLRKWPIFMCILTSMALAFQAQAATDGQKRPNFATEYFDRTGIYWQPHVSYERLVVDVSGPGDLTFRREFKAGTVPFLGIYDEAGNSLPDGQYTYELRVVPIVAPEVRAQMMAARSSGDLSVVEELKRTGKLPQETLVQSGHFSIENGAVVVPGGAEGGITPLDVLHYDDVIITGSLCVGFDCQDGESFGFDTIILKEHNLRIYFNDTSYTASYPTNSWRITINDSTNGGASYFSIDDADKGSSPFKIEAGAPSNSLYVEDYGRVGLGTSTPVVELHIKDSDTPTVRLEQDSSGGWTAQTWDVAGNESNFFIRDATNGSKMPFRIQPNTPSSTLCLKSEGKVGIGTWSPEAPLELETTNEDAKFRLDRTDGAKGVLAAGAEYVYLGTQTNHPLKFFTNDSLSMTIDPSGNIFVYGNLELASSRDYKENIQPLEGKEAIGALKALRPVRFNYKRDSSEETIGFIAEEVPDLVATNRRNSLNPMEIVAVLTKAVQEQQEIIEEQQRILQEQRRMISKLAEKMIDLESRMNPKEGKMFFAASLLDSE